MVEACWVCLAAGAGSEGADLTDVHGNHGWKKDKKDTPLNQLYLNVHDTLKIPSAKTLQYIMVVSLSLARDADAPLCLQRGRNSCGSMGSAQRDTGLALRRGLCRPVAPLLSVSSWSLLTASREKVNPFS